MELDGLRFHLVTWNGTQFKTFELFISGISHIMFLDHSRPQVSETTESKTMDKWRTTIFYG
jgi:hypothetical protein